MTQCNVCGAEKFEKHDGFMYCSICQTQSQEFHEQEHEFQQGNSAKRRKISLNDNKQKQENFQDFVFWTSWETFNCILHGMVEELKNQVPETNFEILVFKLWAAYLQKCKVAFVSRYREEYPKLGLGFKHCDARVLYNIDDSFNLYRAHKKEHKKSSSKCSNSSISSYSKKSLAHKKNKVIVSDYEEYLSLSNTGYSSFTDDSLDSFRKDTDEKNATDSASGSIFKIKSFKEVFERKDYKLFKNIKKCSKLMNQVKQQVTKNIKFFGKNKLLSIIHLALLMTGSEIQLADLLRFIREGHISFAKVTHFLPEEVKFAKKDSSYIDVISDSSMPTHLRQRQITSQLAVLLKIKAIPTPNMILLIERYCLELNLPEGIKSICEKIIKICVPDLFIPRSKSLIPSYEAWAIVSVIFVMKLLFGLNDKTEIFLSFLARKINSKEENCNNKLFVFEDWQKFLECRKAVLTEFHFPTLEQLRRNDPQSSDKFLNTLVKESKDEYRDSRFISYTKYYVPESLSKGIRQTLSELTKSQDFGLVDFQPSITPQAANLKTIFSKLRDQKSLPNILDENVRPVLGQDFAKYTVEYAFNPSEYFSRLKTDDSFTFQVNDSFKSSVFDTLLQEAAYRDIFLNCSSSYWMVHCVNMRSSRLECFKEETFEKMPENFKWLIKECSRMVEMNVRDVYTELLRFERILSFA